jgi:urease gamma subunit
MNSHDVAANSDHMIQHLAIEVDIDEGSLLVQGIHETITEIDRIQR